MHRKRKRFYLFAITLLLLGYTWLLYLKLFQHYKALPAAGSCMFKQITGIACPSCGSSRSVLAMLNNQFMEALIWNPLGFIIAAVLLILPFTIVYDLVWKQQLTMNCYIRMEKLFRKPVITIAAVILILLNWIWNIYKGV